MATSTFLDRLEAQKADAFRRKVPVLEHRGVWQTLARWPIDEYRALRRTLAHFNSYGDELCESILWLYEQGLNLPLKYAEDQQLIVLAVENHARARKEGWPKAPSLHVTWTPEQVCNEYAGQLAKIMGVTA